MLKIVRKAEPYLEDSSDSRQTKYISTTIVDSIEIKRKYDSGIAIKDWYGNKNTTSWGCWKHPFGIPGVRPINFKKLFSAHKKIITKIENEQKKGTLET